MSIQSARSHLEELGAKSYCFPLSLDAVMHKADLPDEYYEMFGAANCAGSKDYNLLAKSLLADFFKVTPVPEVDGVNDVAVYTAYNAGVQPYCPDVPYEYDLAPFKRMNVTHKHIRLKQLLRKSAQNGCNILFSALSADGEHVAGLELVDTEPESYIIRNTGDYLRPAGDRIYKIDELWWNGKDKVKLHRDKYAPLPEVAGEFYPDGQTSWELFIFPPEPLSK